MGLLPEFFMLLGIGVFLAMSFLSFLLDDEMPSSFQYLFQGAAIVGLGLLFTSRGLVNTGFLGRAPTDITRFWLSVVYLASAVSIVIGLNVYLAAVRRKIDLASIFSGTVTVPIFMISALFVSSFLASGGNVSLTPATIGMLAVAGLVIGLSMFGFLREASKHISNAPAGPGLLPTGPLAMSPGGTGIMRGGELEEEEWEESPRKDEGEE